MVLSKDDKPEMAQIRELSENALNKAVEWGLIKATDVDK